jgi:hypothetical protein
MVKSIERPTHVRVIIAPKAGYLRLEGCAADASGTVFTVDQGKEIWDFMVKKGKELKREVKFWTQTVGAKTPVVMFNKHDKSPFIAMVDGNKPSKTTKVVL